MEVEELRSRLMIERGAVEWVDSKYRGLRNGMMTEEELPRSGYEVVSDLRRR